MKKQIFPLHFPRIFLRLSEEKIANPKSTEDLKHEANGRKRCCQERYQKHEKKRRFFMCITFSMKPKEKKQRHENGNETSFSSSVKKKKFFSFRILTSWKAGKTVLKTPNLRGHVRDSTLKKVGGVLKMFFWMRMFFGVKDGYIGRLWLCWMFDEWGKWRWERFWVFWWV